MYKFLFLIPTCIKSKERGRRVVGEGDEKEKGRERDQGKRVRRKNESFLHVALLTQPAGGSLKTLSCFIHFSLAQVGLPQQELSRVHLREDKHIHHSNIVLVCVCVCVCVCV